MSAPASLDTLLREVHYVAWVARQTWEDLWPGYRRMSGDPTPDAQPASLGACIPTSLALAGLLNMTHGAERHWYWRTRGGYRTRRGTMGGVTMLEGNGGAHSWVEGQRLSPGPRQVITADITLDQFGGPAVLVLAGRPETHRHNYSRALIERFKAGVGFHASLWQATAQHALAVLGTAGDDHPDIIAEQDAADRHLYPASATGLSPHTAVLGNL